MLYLLDISDVCEERKKTKQKKTAQIFQCWISPTVKDRMYEGVRIESYLPLVISKKFYYELSALDSPTHLQACCSKGIEKCFSMNPVLQPEYWHFFLCN